MALRKLKHIRSLKDLTGIMQGPVSSREDALIVISKDENRNSSALFSFSVLFLN